MSTLSNIQLTRMPSGAEFTAVPAAGSVPSAPTKTSQRQSAKPTRRTHNATRMPSSARAQSRVQAGVQARTWEHAQARTQVAADRTSNRANSKSKAAGTHSPAEVLQNIVGAVTETRARRVLCLTVISLLLLGWAVYPPVRDYYVASRDREILTARYEELSATNDELMHDISYLQSAEGIEDEARRRGYVLYGETGVSVEGLEEDTSTEDAQEELSDTTPWHTRVLDFLFGYEPTEW